MSKYIFEHITWTDNTAFEYENVNVIVIVVVVKVVLLVE